MEASWSIADCMILYTGNARYKELENRVFVGQGRFRTEKGKPIFVEYKVGQVVSS